MKYTALGILLGIVSACGQSETRNPYKMSDKYFAQYDEVYHGQITPLPVEFLENISHVPKTECEREGLKQAFIIAHWQLEDFNNQGYVLRADSAGVETLLQAFPEISPKDVLRESGRVAMTNTLKEALLEVRTECSRGEYPYVGFDRE